jgi:hypothetical protein
MNDTNEEGHPVANAPDHSEKIPQKINHPVGAQASARALYGHL